MSVELTDAAAWAWWRRNAEAQGISPELDPAVIRKVATLALTGSDDDTGRALALAPRPANGSADQKRRGPSRPTTGASATLYATTGVVRA